MNWFLLLSYASIGFLVVYAVYCVCTKRSGSWSNLGIDFRTLQFRRPQREKRQSKGEAECKRVMESIYGRPFKNMRPDFLRNSVTGGNFNLELDCFSPELGVACEYNGRQHYEFIPHFHRNKEAFLNQQYRDDMKRRICKENGVVLIEVPYSVRIEDIEDYIKKKLKAMKQDRRQ